MAGGGRGVARGVSGPRLSLVVLSGSRAVSDLEVYSPGTLGLPSGPDC